MYAAPHLTNRKTAINNPTVIDMANASYSIAPAATEAQLPQKQRARVGKGKNGDNRSESISMDDRLDAARAMLGISPCSVTDDSIGSIMGSRVGEKRNDKSLLQEASVNVPTTQIGRAHV